MKKVIVSLLLIVLLAGCTNNLMNTPTKKVEELLNNYVTLNKDVLNDLDSTLLSESIMTSEQKDRYRDIIKKQYQHLSYEIKDEVIDGDKATVEVAVTLYDYNKIITEAEDYYNSNQDEFLTDNNNNNDNTDNNIGINKYNDYKLDLLEKAKDKVTYTLNLTLKKVNDEWKLDDLTDVEIQKLHGLYAS